MMPSQPGDKPTVVSLRFPAIRESLADAGDRIEEALADIGMPHARALRVELAIEEILVNIISYAYPKGVAGDIEIIASVAPDRVTLTVMDWGAPFNPIEQGEVNTTGGLDDRTPGGLGIHLVREVASDVRYVRDRDRNILTIEFSAP